MSGTTSGQDFVFWCALLGLVVIFCAEVFRAYQRSRPPLGPKPNHRLRNELNRPRRDDESPDR